MDVMFQKIINKLRALLYAVKITPSASTIENQSEPRMDATNDIIKAVKTYIETPETKYAIMIDGDWGCGKTFLWKDTLFPRVGKLEAIYISMFGLKDINDIENEIFKSLSMMGADKDGVLKGLLNFNPDMAEDIRFGGLGFAVQFGLKKWKETRIEKSKRLFICFDDLERWAGDIEICLSYINKLVEHDGAKCLIIGNAKEIEEKNKNKFQDTTEVIESLRNDQLFELTRWMGSRINEGRSCLDAVEKEYDRAQAIAGILEKKYIDQYGVKAGHIKQIARVIRNKRTDYDPEYIDKNKKT